LRTKLESYKAALILFIFLPILLSGTTIPHTSAQSSPSRNGTSTVQVSIVGTIDPSYDVFDLNLPLLVNISIHSTSAPLATNQTILFVLSFVPNSAGAIVHFANGSSTPTVILASSGVGGSSKAFQFNLPAGSTGFDANIQGIQFGAALLFRDAIRMPTFGIENFQNATVSQNTTIVTRPGNLITESFDFVGHSTPLPSIVQKGASNVTFSVPSGVYFIVMQSHLFFPASVAVTLVAAIFLILLALGLFARSRKVFDPLWNRFVGVLSSLRPLASKMSIQDKVRQPHRASLARTMLIMFITCAILMIAIAAIAGPDPQTKVYVIATPSQANLIHKNLLPIRSNLQMITPAQDFSDFAVMSSVGDFNIAVISSFPTVNLPEVSYFVLPNLGNVPVIVVDNTSDPLFATQVSALYTNRVIHVANAANLSSSDVRRISIALNAATGQKNPFGVQIGGTSFKLVVVIEAGFSFLLVFLGWSALGLYAAEANNENSLQRLALMIALGVFVFYFSETTYVLTSSLLRFPLSLHAVISGAKSITAVGYLGFGGGSTPRLLAGAVGILFGSFIGGWNSRFSKRGFGIMIAIIVLIIANPFLLGQLAFQGILLYAGGMTIGTAYSSALTFKQFLYTIGSGVGGNVSPVYLMSAGKILAFAGLVPLAFLNKMPKITASFTVLFCAIAVGVGGIRVGEMTPTKTVIAVVPGLMSGLIFALILLLIALLEKYLVSSRVVSVQ